MYKIKIIEVENYYYKKNKKERDQENKIKRENMIRDSKIILNNFSERNDEIDKR